MSEVDFLSNRYILLVLGGAIGIVATLISRLVLNKRGTFSYFATHNKIGTSSVDKFGEISVTWNKHPVGHLFFSTLELRNGSLNDYENVSITAYTADTILLTEFIALVDAPFIVEWSEDYKEKLHVEEGQSATTNQVELYGRQRDYSIPVFNRGQIVTMSYLNAAQSDTGPHIFLDANARGVTLKLRVPQQQILGVPVQQASISGAVSGFVVMVLLVLYVSSPWLIALIAMLYGFGAQLPGALFVKALRSIRQAIGN